MSTAVLLGWRHPAVSERSSQFVEQTRLSTLLEKAEPTVRLRRRQAKPHGV
jgi:hypothetical protein